MNSISVSFHPQKEPVVCPQCGSTARVARDLCLRCMLLLGIAACGDTSEILNDALSEIDVQDAEHVVGELVVAIRVTCRFAVFTRPIGETEIRGID